MPFCTNCGNENPQDARFCSQCGTRVAPAPVPAAAEGRAAADPAQAASGDASADATGQIAAVEDHAESTSTHTFAVPEKTEASSDRLNPVDAAAVDALPPGHALLVVQRGPGAGNRFLLDTDLVKAGRHPDSEIFLDDVTVSRRHAEFRRDQDAFAVRDSGSLNGTYVNRDRIDAVDLKDGDEVQIGKYRLVFFAGHRQG